MLILNNLKISFKNFSRSCQSYSIIYFFVAGALGEKNQESGRRWQAMSEAEKEQFRQKAGEGNSATEQPSNTDSLYRTEQPSNFFSTLVTMFIVSCDSEDLFNILF